MCPWQLLVAIGNGFQKRGDFPSRSNNPSVVGSHKSGRLSRQTRRGAFLQQGCAAYLAGSLSKLPHVRRNRTDASGHLSRCATLGRCYPRVRKASQNAPLVRRSKLWRICEQSTIKRCRDRKDRRVGSSRCSAGREDGCPGDEHSPPFEDFPRDGDHRPETDNDSSRCRHRLPIRNSSAAFYI